MHNFQLRQDRGKYKVQLNTDGRNCLGPYDCRYKTSITTFSGLQKYRYVGDSTGLAPNSITTRYSIGGKYEKRGPLTSIHAF